MQLDRRAAEATRARRSWRRSSLLPQSDLDAAEDRRRLRAGRRLASQQATVTQAQAGVSQSQASVNQNQVNLDHTVDRRRRSTASSSQRSVDVGQTVAASMQAPTLFIIAADLTKMQVNANIDEADVGRIRPGQHVTFQRRRLSRPTRFDGTVAQIRLQPVVVQNVTTYGTVIDVPNAQLKLKPGMTANVKVEIAKRTDVLRVPNAALRFRPTTEVFAALNQPVPPEAQIGGGRSAARGGRARRPRRRERRQRRPARHLRGARSPAERRHAPTRPEPTAISGAGGRRRRVAGAVDAFDPARMMERFKGMSPDEQKQFIARMKDRGQDTSAFERNWPQRPRTPAGARRKTAARRGAQTIDALFAPLPSVESRGRAWLFMDHQLKPVNLRLGITDGTNTEAAQRRAAAEHGGRDRRHRASGTTRDTPADRQPAIR